MLSDELRYASSALQVLPALSYPNVVTMYGVVLTVMGMFIAWPAPACNNPVFAEIVPPPMRNMVYGERRDAARHRHIAGWSTLLSV